MTELAVVIAGGGPTGLMLAGELALAGVDVVVIERRASQDLPGSRAGGLKSRTIPDSAGARRRAKHLVRTAFCGLAALPRQAGAGAPSTILRRSPRTAIWSVVR
jgi:choline dehydrogenase-like flavoprotein